MDFFIPSDDQHIKKEREQARRMRRTSWWYTLVNRGECYYCHETFTKENLTMDHIIPLSRGGCSTKGNIVIACKMCNTKKRDSLLVDSEL